jgi:hypothetical protein
MFRSRYGAVSAKTLNIVNRYCVSMLCLIVSSLVSSPGRNVIDQNFTVVY